MKHILFDLDGTLLPMDQDSFTKFYLSRLSKFLLEKGFAIEPETFFKAMLKGVGAMSMNDGIQTNEEIFWQAFLSMIPVEREKLEPVLLEFYQTVFNETKVVASPTPLSRMVIDAAKEKGLNLYLATNPLFPQVATYNRINWAGLSPEDFIEVTTFENYHYAKPNPRYFQEILDKFHLDPKDCLMVGNDFVDDMAVAALGIDVYIITDFMDNEDKATIQPAYRGSMEDFLHFIQSL